MTCSGAVWETVGLAIAAPEIQAIPRTLAGGVPGLVGAGCSTWAAACPPAQAMQAYLWQATLRHQSDRIVAASTRRRGRRLAR